MLGVCAFPKPSQFQLSDRRLLIGKGTKRHRFTDGRRRWFVRSRGINYCVWRRWCSHHRLQKMRNKIKKIFYNRKIRQYIPIFCPGPVYVSAQHHFRTTYDWLCGHGALVGRRSGAHEVRGHLVGFCLRVLDLEFVVEHVEFCIKNMWLKKLLCSLLGYCVAGPRGYLHSWLHGFLIPARSVVSICSASNK